MERFLGRCEMSHSIKGLAPKELGWSRYGRFCLVLFDARMVVSNVYDLYLFRRVGTLTLGFESQLTCPPTRPERERRGRLAEFLQTGLVWMSAAPSPYAPRAV